MVQYLNFWGMPIFWFDPVRKKIGLSIDFWWSSQSIILLEIGNFRFGHLEFNECSKKKAYTYCL